MSLLSLVSPCSGARALPAFLDGGRGAALAPRGPPGAGRRPAPAAPCSRTARRPAARPGLRGAVTGPALAELAEGRVPVPGAALSTRAAAVELVAGRAAAAAAAGGAGGAVAA